MILLQQRKPSFTPQAWQSGCSSQLSQVGGFLVGAHKLSKWAKRSPPHLRRRKQTGTHGAECRPWHCVPFKHSPAVPLLHPTCQAALQNVLTLTFPFCPLHKIPPSLHRYDRVRAHLSWAREEGWGWCCVSWVKRRLPQLRGRKQMGTHGLKACLSIPFKQPTSCQAAVYNTFRWPYQIRNLSQWAGNCLGCNPKL